MVITLEHPKRGRRLPAIISPKNIPESLVYEMIDGKTLYRKGYKQVLVGKKTLEEIMGASSLLLLSVSSLTNGVRLSVKTLTTTGVYNSVKIKLIFIGHAFLTQR